MDWKELLTYLPDLICVFACVIGCIVSGKKTSSLKVMLKDLCPSAEPVEELREVQSVLTETMEDCHSRLSELDRLYLDLSGYVGLHRLKFSDGLSLSDVVQNLVTDKVSILTELSDNVSTLENRTLDLKAEIQRINDVIDILVGDDVSSLENRILDLKAEIQRINDVIDILVGYDEVNNGSNS